MSSLRHFGLLLYFDAPRQLAGLTSGDDVGLELAELKCDSEVLARGILLSSQLSRSVSPRGWLGNWLMGDVQVLQVDFCLWCSFTLSSPLYISALLSQSGQ